MQCRTPQISVTSASPPLGHISESVDTFEIPNLQKLDMANITPLKQVAPTDHPLTYYGKLREKSRGKDTMTGHWEMMGLEMPEGTLESSLLNFLK